MIKSFLPYDTEELPANRFEILEAARLGVELYYESPRENYEAGLLERKNFIEVVEEEDSYIGKLIKHKLTEKGKILLSKINGGPGTFRVKAKTAFWLFTDKEREYLDKKFSFK